MTNQTNIEVFKTNINCPQKAGDILREIILLFPHSIPNIDLDDCDKVLRIEGSGIEIHQVVEIVVNTGYHCELMD